MSSYKGSVNKTSCACVYVMAHLLQVCPNQEGTAENATVLSPRSELHVMSSNDASEFFSTNSLLLSRNEGSNDSRSKAPVLNVPENFNITGKLDECLKNGSQMFDCLHLLNIVLGKNDRSLGSLLEDFCSSASYKKAIGQEGSNQHMGSRSKEFTSHLAEKSVLLKYLASTISALGIICNLVPIVVILKNAKLRKPFYISILSLAVADVLYQVNFILSEFLEIPSSICETLWFKRLFDLTTYTTKMFSSLNVIVLLTLRYAMFVHPLKCRAYLTNRKIYITSVICLILSIVYGVLIVEVIWSLNTPYLYFLYIADDGLLLFVIVVLNIYFVVNRCKIIRSSLAARNLEKRMLLMVLCILFLRTVSSLFSILQSSLSDGVMTDLSYNENFDEDVITIHVSKVLKVLVYSVNPLIYFFSSANVLKVSLPCFRCHNE